MSADDELDAPFEPVTIRVESLTMSAGTHSETRLSPLARLAGLFSPGREHSVTSAAALLMIATMLARLVGYLRDAYIAYAFGAGPVTDAYVAAFTLPDFLLYLAAGGSISVTFISLFTKYLAEKREAEAQE